MTPAQVAEVLAAAEALAKAQEVECHALDARERRDTKANQERFNEANRRVGMLSYELAQLAPAIADLARLVAGGEEIEKEAQAAYREWVYDNPERWDFYNSDHLEIDQVVIHRSKVDARFREIRVKAYESRLASQAEGEGV